MNKWESLSSPFFNLSLSNWALIPLEAWRRGLNVRLRPNARYSISDGERSFDFRQTRLSGPVYDSLARSCDNKGETKDVLSAAGVQVASGKRFQGPTTADEVIAAADAIGYPVCLKANAWAKARGVFPGIANASVLAERFEELTQAMGCDDFIVEEHVDGELIRVVVVGDHAVSAVRTVPANILGDGVSTISELVSAKNAERELNPYMRLTKVTLDEDSLNHLAESGLAPDSVVPAGTVVYLGKPANGAMASDVYEVLDSISSHVLRLAEAAVKAVPSLEHAGIDVLVEDYLNPQSRAVVLEVNPSAGLGSHLFPAEGPRRDIPGLIIDHYFPGSKRIEGSKNWHFSLRSINRLFTAQTASEVELAPLPQITDPTWRTILLEPTGEPLNVLRRQVMEKLQPLRVHGSVAAQGAKQLKVRFVGTEAQCSRAWRELSRIGRARVASRAAFVAAPGLQSI